MIELAALDRDEDTEVVGFQWARLRVGPRASDARIVSELTVYERGVCVAQWMEFADVEGTVKPLVEIVWKHLREGFRLAKHNELTDWKWEELRHG